MARNKKNQIKNFSEEITAFSAITPSPISVGSTNESYSSSDGTKIYVQFSDTDSSGLLPTTGIHKRFEITKIISGIAETVNPTSFFIDSSLPKTVQLTLNTSDILIDGLYDGTSGIRTSIQTVFVNYTTSTSGGLGTIPLLTDNNTIKTNVASFTGLGISNRTSEANGPVFLYAYSSTDGTKVYSVFREASPPLLPSSSIGGFTVSQSSSNKNILNAYVLDPTSETDGKIVVIDLEYPLAIDNGSNPVTLTYTQPSLSTVRLKDSSPLQNLASSFSGAAVTNNTSETIRPRVVDAFTSASSTQYVYVTMSEPTLPGSGVSGFSIYVNNSLNQISSASVANTTYSGIGVSQYRFVLSNTFNDYDSLELDYQKPSINYITDQSANLNELLSFNNRFYVRNIYDSSAAGDYTDVFSASESFVDENGVDIYLNFLINRSERLLPLTDIDNFYVFVDGQSSPIKTAESLAVGSAAQVKIKVHNRIHNGSTVKIGYIKGNLTDANSKSFASFEPEEINNNATTDRNDLFDLLQWNTNSENDIRYQFEIGENTSELFRLTNSNINSSVILDTEPPKGIVILNSSYSESSPGINLHKFEAYGNEIEKTGVESDFDLTISTLAWKIKFENALNINTFSVKLKVQNSIQNILDFVRFDLYNNSNDEKPDVIISPLGKIKFSELSSNYQELELILSDDITLEANTDYWILAYCDSIVAVDVNNAPIVSMLKVASEGDFIAQNSLDTTSGWLSTENFSAYHKITSTSNTEIQLNSKNYLLDLFESPVRELSFDYSDVSYKQYEIFGDEEINYVHKKLNKIYEDQNDFSNDIYPYVSKIEIGASSLKPKSYILEFKTHPSNDWVQLFDTLTDETTLDNLVYNFDSPIRISDIRLVYKGDYFTIDAQGNLSITAYDDLSEVKDIQISHFSDFRDANDFSLSDDKGFVKFQEGTTDYLNWPITNNALTFKATKNAADSEVLQSISFGSKIILAANNKVYVYYNGTVNSISNTNLIDNNNQITCFAQYKNKLYLGTSDGLIFSSLTGDFWSIVNGANSSQSSDIYKNIKPITSMAVFGDKLYIGSSKGNSNSCSLYSYDGMGISKIKDFDSAFDKVSALTTANFNLYIGLGGIYGSGNSSIYIYDGLTWQQTLASTSDNVDVLNYSTARNSIVAGFRGGKIYELSFQNNLPTSWSIIYDLGSDIIFSISDDPNGQYLFICADNKSVVYIKNTNSFRVITSYKATESGLNLNKKKYNSYSNSYSENKTNIESFLYQSYSTISSDINYSNFGSIGFTNNSRSLITGFIKAKTDGDYKIKIISNMGNKLSLAGLAVTSNFASIGITTNITFETPQSYNLSQNELLEFELESFISENTTPTLELYWNNISGIDGYEIIPNDYFARSSKVKNIVKLNNSFYGIGSDGKVYLFDVDFYSTKLRNVYVRVRDEIDNIQSVVISGRNITYPALSDKILQDLNTVDNAYQTRGKIYQISKQSDNSLETKVIYTPTSRQYSIYAPDRVLKEVAVYESEPFFVPTIVKWSSMVNLIVNKYALNQINGEPIEGLDAGTAVRVYIRTGNTRFDCLNNNYSSAYEVSYINNNSNIPPVETQTINLENFNGKWLQYKFELISASRNVSPEILSSTITYVAGTASYYFTKIFDTSDYDSTAPVIRRGLLTSNELVNNGSITYGYINSNDSNDIYDFNKYNEIIPNKIFEINSPTKNIKFGILFTSVGSNPSMVYDFAVQLDVGNSNIKFMPSL